MYNWKDVKVGDKIEIFYRGVWERVTIYCIQWSPNSGKPYANVHNPRVNTSWYLSDSDCRLPVYKVEEIPITFKNGRIHYEVRGLVKI